MLACRVDVRATLVRSSAIVRASSFLLASACIWFNWSASVRCLLNAANRSRFAHVRREGHLPNTARIHAGFPDTNNGKLTSQLKSRSFMKFTVRPWIKFGMILERENRRPRVRYDSAPARNIRIANAGERVARNKVAVSKYDPSREDILLDLELSAAPSP